MIEKSKFFQYLYPTDGEEIIERPADFMWFRKDGILCTVPKEEVKEMSLAEMMEQVDEFQALYGKGKFKMLSVINPKAKSNKEGRDFAAEILPDIVDGIAIINNSPLGRMAINLFIGLKPPTYPLKIFKNQEEALEWLKAL